MVENPVAMITGGASGIGFALARHLAARKVRVVLADIDDSAIRQATARFDVGAVVQAIRLDVTDAAAVEAAVGRVAAEHGRLDYLFNNAGVGGNLDVRHASLALWRRIVELNLMGIVHGVHAAYPIMVSQGNGHIVNTASISGLVPWPGQTLYNTTKYAVVGLSHTLRTEAARHGVKVNVVCPGAVRSAIWGTPILGERTVQSPPADAVPAEDAADIIWRGVQANRATIIFPRQSRRAAWLYRLHPRLLSRRFDQVLSARMPTSSGRT